VDKLALASSVMQTFFAHALKQIEGEIEMKENQSYGVVSSCQPPAGTSINRYRHL